MRLIIEDQMNNQTDEQLVKQAQQGNASAFEALVGRHYGTMFKIAFKWCRNKNDAEDITQDACMKLARGLDSFQGKSSFTSWLYRLVLNCGKDWYKKQNRHPVPSENIEILEQPAKEGTSDEKIYAKQVVEAIHTLPEGEKEAVLLVMGEGLSHKEAAYALDCKESTISWRIHEARKKIGAQFSEEQSYG